MNQRLGVPKILLHRVSHFGFLFALPIQGDYMATNGRPLYPDVVNVEQLCTMLGGIGRKTAYGLLKGGSIRYLKIGKSFKIPKVAVIEYLIDTN